MSQGQSNSPNSPTPPERGKDDDSNSPKRFLTCLRRSGLLSEQELNNSLTKLRNRQPAVKPSATEVANFFVVSGLITKWQSVKLLRGRHKGFFLDKYQLLDHLGTGGMSTVYLAEHSLTGQKRAIKVLPRDKISERSYLERFYREARSVAALNHPNIVRIYDVANEDQTHYMVMEYAKGLDLFDLVTERGQVDFELAQDCIRQTATGLAHAHQNNFVHRDIKPANLLLNQNQQIKILDLGLALLKTDNNQFGLSVRHNEQMMGTADYLAPEQAVNSHEVDHRADIYSLGCTLYYLLTTQPPFPDGTLAQRVAAHQNQEPEPISDLRPDCPEQLVAICKKMMSKDPDERFQSCEDLIEAIDGKPIVIAQPAAKPTSPAPTTSNSKAKPSRSTSINPVAKSTPTPTAKAKRKKSKSIVPMLAMLGGLAVCVLALAFFVFTKSGATADKNSEQKAPAFNQSREHGQSTDLDKQPTPKSREPAPTTPTDILAELANTNSPAIASTGEVIDFENSAQFPNRRDQWDIKLNHNIIGTLHNHGKAKVVDAPKPETGPIKGKCLLLKGNSKQVEFRPIDESARIKSVHFDAIRTSQQAAFGFELEAKSNVNHEKWQTVYVAGTDLDENKPIRIVIGEEDFNTMEAWKFRFRLEGESSNGILIDNLVIELR